MQPKAYILDRHAATNSLYTAWLNDCRYECVIVKEPAYQWSPPEDVGIIITHLHYQWETISTLRRVFEQGQIPILVLCDGVLEFRNTFQNPTIAPGSLFQPLLGHKLACLGRAPARQLEALGNAGKCEIVGCPRLDRLYDFPHTPVQDSGPFRLLVTTARTPAFTEDQHRAVVLGLRGLQQRLRRNPLVAGRKIDIKWRLPASTSQPLQLPGPTEETLDDAIERSDAVITTPSTVYLESLIRRRPTAVLDYTNSPAYIPAAWSISADRHINPVLEELANPPASKMLFQQQTLHDQLVFNGNATSRLNALIHRMVTAGIEARQNECPLTLPPRILSDPQRGIAHVESDFDLQSLFPDHPVYQCDDVTLLRQELVQAVARLGQLPRELSEKDDYIEHLHEVLRVSAERLAEAQQRATDINEILDKRMVDMQNKSDHIDYLTDLLASANQQLNETEQRRRQAEQALARHRQRLDSMARQLHQLLDDTQLDRARDNSTESVA